MKRRSRIKIVIFLVLAGIVTWWMATSPDKLEIKACLIIASLVLLWMATSPDKDYSGKSIELRTGEDYRLIIDAPSLTIEAASSYPFELKGPNGETITGVKAERPRGWKERTYYEATPADAQGGTWDIKEGKSLTVILKSADYFTAREAVKPAVKVFALMLALALLVVLVTIARLLFPIQDPDPADFFSAMFGA